MGRRLELQQLLEDVLGSRNVYFQPPETIKMTYPCVVYSLETYPSSPADDLLYKTTERYIVTYIDRNPDSNVPETILHTRGFQFDRRYNADNLHHSVFTYTFY